MIAPLLRQRIRRDRVQLLLWILGAVALALASVSGVTESYGTDEDRRELLAAVMANPVILMFRGLPSGSGEAEFVLFLILPFLAMIAAFMSAFLAVRHTRAEEEQGRADLVSSTRAGRLTPLTATVAHGVIANTVLGAGVTAVYLAFGYHARGAAITGLATASVGVCFLGVGVLAAQLMRTSRGANSTTVWLLVTTFAMSGLGNALGTPSDDLTRIESGWLSWLSPFGWAENTRPFSDDASWPALLGIGAAAACTAIAFVVQAQRDLGEGIVPQRRGRASASRTLASPLGLVWRQSRGSVLGWAIGGLVTGLLATSLASVVSELGTRIPAVETLFRTLSQNGGLDEGMIVIFYVIVGVLAACAAVQTVSRARQEEARGTAEAVLAAATDRTRWLGGFLVVAVVAIVLTVAAAIAGSALGAASSDSALWTDALVAGAGQALAACVFLALTALVFVIAPRATILVGWTLVLVSLAFGLFGPLLALPEGISDLSPFTQTPQLTGGGVDLKGTWWLASAAILGAAASLTLMYRRELHPG